MSDEQQAAGLIKLGIRRLLSLYPLLGALAANWEIRADPTIGTMGVGMGEFRIQLFYAPKFVCKISLEELTGVLHHEARHIIYGHVFALESNYPDKHARTIAEEVTVNENLFEPLPLKPILLADYPQLPADESMLERYKRLAKASPPPGNPPNGNTDASVDAINAPGSPQDNHSRWDTFQNNKTMAESQIVKAARAALNSGNTLSDAEVSSMEEIERSVGLYAGMGRSELPESLVHDPLDWRDLLRQFVGRATAPTFSFRVPSRRLPKLIGIVPGKRRCTARPRILAALDTSGSMTEENLAEISTEFTFLSKRSEIIVAECDAEVQRVYPYRVPIREVWGRGGTNFCPPLQADFIETIRPDVICFFTDGDGPAPRSAPTTPLIWVLTPGGKPPAAWGTVAWMKGPENALG